MTPVVAIGGGVVRVVARWLLLPLGAILLLLPLPRRRRALATAVAVAV